MIQRIRNLVLLTSFISVIDLLLHSISELMFIYILLGLTTANVGLLAIENRHKEKNVIPDSGLTLPDSKFGLAAADSVEQPRRQG